tara:strand:+ start:2136 stop:3227 length:1092 start_codon:yes stop_codon:yes gene_type:complete
MRIRLVIITKNNEENIKLIINKLIKYVYDICLYDFNSSDNTVNVVESLCEIYEKNLIIKEVTNLDYNNILIYSINENLVDNDYIITLNGNDNLNRFNVSFLDNLISERILFYEINIHDKHNEKIERQKILFSKHCKWEICEFTNYVSPKIIINNEIGKVDSKNWISRNIDYSYNNIEKMRISYEKNAINIKEDSKYLLIIGEHYLNSNKIKDSIQLLTIFTDVAFNLDKMDIYTHYMGLVLLAKAYILGNKSIFLIRETIGKAINLIPTKQEAYSLMGNFLYDVCNYDTSYYLFKDCLNLEIDSKYPVYYKSCNIEGNYKIIFALMMTGEMDEAKKYLNMLKELNDENFAIMINNIENILEEN